MPPSVRQAEQQQQQQQRTVSASESGRVQSITQIRAHWQQHLIGCLGVFNTPRARKQRTQTQREPGTTNWNWNCCVCVRVFVSRGPACVFVSRLSPSPPLRPHTQAHNCCVHVWQRLNNCYLSFILLPPPPQP